MEAAEAGATLAEDGENANPIISQIVNSYIAYADAVTAKYGGRVNQKSHDAAVKSLRSTLGNRLPNSQETRFRRALQRKDEVQYGARRGRLKEAKILLADLREFAAWAEGMMAER